MEQFGYFREQLNVLTQFAAAFDGAFVYRYTKDFLAKEKINVRYVFGPKHRILYDIVNQAKNMTLPVISFNQTNLRRDSSRIQFKDQRMTFPHRGNTDISKIPSPIPVTMDVEVSIVANYKEDIDQIIQNIIPWANPYFIIAWKIPEEFGLDYIGELRTECTWSGDISYENPTNLEKDAKYRIVGNTSFNIKGWIFPPFETPSGPIYVVNANFWAVSSGTSFDGDITIPDLSAGDVDTILISAYPSFTNFFYKGIPIFEESITITGLDEHTFTFFGKRFSFNNTWYLSGSNVSDFAFTEIDTAKFPTISAYLIPSQYVETSTDNIATIQFDQTILSAGNFTFVTANSAGWERIENNIIVI